MFLTLFSTSAAIRGTGTGRLGPLHHEVAVWADDEDAVKHYLNSHPTYTYDYINRPSVYAVNPDGRLRRTVLNPPENPRSTFGEHDRDPYVRTDPYTPGRWTGD